jgi:hypothetical protein
MRWKRLQGNVCCRSILEMRLDALKGGDLQRILRVLVATRLCLRMLLVYRYVASFRVVRAATKQCVSRTLTTGVLRQRW